MTYDKSIITTGNININLMQKHTCKILHFNGV